MDISIYTDGSYSLKTNCGGWSCLIVCPNNTLMYTYADKSFNSSNNQEELKGFTQALQFIKLNYETVEHFSIYTDSAYVCNCFKDKWYEKWLTNNWIIKNKAIKNRELWEQILNLFFEVKDKVTINKVDGHSDNEWNNKADLVANHQRQIAENAGVK